MEKGFLGKLWNTITIPYLSVSGMVQYFKEKEAAEQPSPEQGKRQWFNHVIRNALTYDLGPVSLEDDAWLIEKFEAELERCGLEKSIAQDMLTHFRSLPEEMERSIEEAQARVDGYNHFRGKLRGLYKVATARVEEEQWQKQHMEEFMRNLLKARAASTEFPALVN